MSLFKVRVFTVALLFAFLLAGAQCYVYYGPAFVQSIMGLNATTAGLLVTIPSLLSIVLSTLIGIWLSKTGRYKGDIPAKFQIHNARFRALCESCRATG
jgi:hypothetical protein